MSQNYKEMKIAGINCFINSDLAEAMENDNLAEFTVENYIEGLKTGNGLNPDCINFETGEFQVETTFIHNMKFVIRGEVVFEGKDEEGQPESWHLNEAVGLEFKRVR